MPPKYHPALSEWAEVLPTWFGIVQHDILKIHVWTLTQRQLKYSVFLRHILLPFLLQNSASLETALVIKSEQLIVTNYGIKAKIVPPLHIQMFHCNLFHYNSWSDPQHSIGPTSQAPIYDALLHHITYFPKLTEKAPQEEKGKATLHWGEDLELITRNRFSTDLLFFSPSEGRCPASCLWQERGLRCNLYKCCCIYVTKRWTLDWSLQRTCARELWVVTPPRVRLQA